MCLSQQGLGFSATVTNILLASINILNSNGIEANSSEHTTVDTNRSWLW